MLTLGHDSRPLRLTMGNNRLRAYREKVEGLLRGSSLCQFHETHKLKSFLWHFKIYNSNLMTKSYENEEKHLECRQEDAYHKLPAKDRLSIILQISLCEYCQQMHLCISFHWTKGKGRCQVLMFVECELLWFRWQSRYKEVAPAPCARKQQGPRLVLQVTSAVSIGFPAKTFLSASKQMNRPADHGGM